MKLNQITEARYDAQHPVIKWLYQFMEGPFKSPVAFGDKQFSTVDEALHIRDIVIAEFGPPQETDTSEWNFSEWMIFHDDRRFNVEIGHGLRGPHAPGPDSDIQIICRSTGVPTG